MCRGKAFAALMIAAVSGLVGVTPASATDDLSLNVDPGSVNVQPGDIVTVTLDLANLSAPINGVQVRLFYDTAIMTLIDVAPTILTLPVGSGWIEVSESDSFGDVDWAAVITSDQVGTNHTVAILTFTVIDEGDTTVTFRADSPPFFTKLTTAADSVTILPSTLGSGTIFSSCDDGLACTTDSVVGGLCQNTVDSAGTTCRTSTGPCDLAEVCDGVSGACPADSLEPAGTVCNVSIGPCDAAEVCDGASAACPVDLLEPAGTVCRAPTGPCDTAETCDGASVTCPSDLLEPAGTECRPSTGLCDPAETCDGVFATCPADALEPAGFVCRASTDECDPQEVCNGISNTCPSDSFVANGTTCTDDGLGCSNDFCFSGACIHPVQPSGFVCRASTDECDPQEVCDGILSSCPADALIADGASCTDDGLTCSDDVCQTGVCSHPARANGFVCRASTDECDPQEICDGIVLSCPTDAITPNGTICTDDGFGCTDDACQSGICSHPTQPAGFECRASTDECDPAETCNGVATTCPGDSLTADGTACADDGLGCTDDVCQVGICVHPTQTAGFVCRASTDECDPQETCDGIATTCPADTLTADGTGCTDDGEGCTSDTCQAGVCSHPVLAAGFVCRASTDECDPEETCDGVATACPADTLTADGTTCADDGLGCTDDTCQTGVCSHPTQSAGFECRASIDECDPAETCDGIATTCPVDDGLVDGTICTDDGLGCTDDVCAAGVCTHPVSLSGTVCRASTDECDPEETCDGVFNTCPSDSLIADGTACTDDGLGCTDDTCQAGVCSHPTQAAGFVCRASTDECDPQETCDGVATACPGDAFTADGAACTDDGLDCTDDTCQTGVCSHPTQAAGFVCRASTDECDPQETCDGVDTVCPGDAFTADGTTCTDDGLGCTDDTCQTGVCSHPTQAAGFVCRASTDECDPQETCDGVDTNCPGDLTTADGSACTDDGQGCTDDICAAGVCTHPTQPAGFVCRASTDECDPEETCDGIATACASDTFTADGTVCTDDGLPCTNDACQSGVCSHPVSASGTVCRASTDECDPAETCDGVASTCGSDVFTADGTVCTDDGLGCTDDTCQTGVCSHPTQVTGFVCRASTDECDPQETCDGIATTCPADAFTADGATCTDDGEGCTDDICQTGVCSHPLELAGFVCRASTDECDPEETCDGAATACPADAFTADGTACTADADACTGDECSAGVCTHPDLTLPGDCCDPGTGVLTTIDDADPCTADLCNADGTVDHTAAGQLTVNLKAEALAPSGPANVTRDVTFIITVCGSNVDTRVVPVNFDGFGQATVVLDSVDAAASWISVSEGHTLSRLESLTITSCSGLVDLSGARLLLAGDLHTATAFQDNLVDILDFSILASRFNDLIDPALSEGGDVTGDGIQGLADFTTMQANFFVVGEATDSCGAVRPGSDDSTDEQLTLATGSSTRQMLRRARSSISVDSLPILGAWRADLTGDGIVDVDDIRAFAARHGLPLLPAFQLKLLRLDAVKAGAVRQRR